MNISSILNGDGTQNSRQLPPLGSRPAQSPPLQWTSSAGGGSTILPGRPFELQMRQDAYTSDTMHHAPWPARPETYSRHQQPQESQEPRYILPHEAGRAASTSSSSTSPPPTESKRKKPYLYAGGFHIKCDECRANSTKCDAAELPSGRCSRCEKYDRYCHRQPRPPTRTQLAKAEASSRPKMFAPLSGPMYTKCGEDERKRRDAYFESKGLPASLLYESTSMR